ncbi:MAG: 7-carboxy-7-deazaguanine synthase [Hyphomicrobium aestuarii]|nr:7-carboxy-7-deazaguanine synthase [Hyphomicrobium aestuarii]
MYAVKEIFYTLQGEGANAGRPAVFCRFSGCNLWSGREADRSTAVCRFCDTDFVGTDGCGGGRFTTATALTGAIVAAAGDAWCESSVSEGRNGQRLVVLTGGEPMLQVDDALIDALHAADIEIAIETNGTLAIPPAIDWICVSPKAGAAFIQRTGDELKLVFPQADLDPAHVRGLAFTHLYLQPMDGPDRVANTEAAIRYCLANPDWRLSVQTHKVLGIR